MLDYLPPKRSAKAAQGQAQVDAFVKEQKPNVCIVLELDVNPATGAFLLRGDSTSEELHLDKVSNGGARGQEV